jgi:ribosomal protein S18 acetylase RimI-like enzyme
MGRLFVLTRGPNILGMVSLLFTISTAEGGKAAWLEDLVVRPEQRQRGLGTRLLRAAVDWARKEGLTRITLLTDAEPCPVASDFESYGLKKFMGKEYMGMMRHTFVVDEKGVLEYIYRKVTAETMADQILKDLGLS